jgi:para-nitrobenzyl esterase
MPAPTDVPNPPAGKPAPPHAASHEPTFIPPTGPVVGRVVGAVVRATGIPYATAERFAAPEAFPDWIEPLYATIDAPASPQLAMTAMDRIVGDSTGGLPQDENCQNLSITMPEGMAPGELLPVMVWIHGGAYAVGAGDAALYDPSSLVSEQRVVVVSVTYRLGILGYLGGSRRPANLGLMDQITALQWIQRNIAAFGGDPRRVTVFGQSAGGDAVAHLMATPDAAQLFSKAIMQSPPLGISRGRQKMSAAMAQAGASIPPNAPIADVIAAQPTVAAAGSAFGLLGMMAFGTQYGQSPLPAENDVDAAWDRVAPSIDILIGHTSEETRLFIAVIPALRQLALVPVVGKPITSFISRLLTQKVYARSTREFAERHGRAGGTAHHYVFTWAPQGNFLGSTHAIDLALLFGNRQTWEGIEVLKGASWEEIHAHGSALRGLWADFARGEQFPDHGVIPEVISYASTTYDGAS